MLPRVSWPLRASRLLVLLYNPCPSYRACYRRRGITISAVRKGMSKKLLRRSNARFYVSESGEPHPEESYSRRERKSERIASGSHVRKLQSLCFSFSRARELLFRSYYSSRETRQGTRYSPRASRRRGSLFPRAFAPTVKIAAARFKSAGETAGLATHCTN